MHRHNTQSIFLKVLDIMHIINEPDINVINLMIIKITALNHLCGLTVSSHQRRLHGK